MAEKSRAERLDSLLAKHAPQAVAHREANGTWPNPNAEDDLTFDESVAKLSAKLQANDKLPADKADAKARDSQLAKRQAPYAIVEKRGKIRLVITGDNGEQVVGVGDTLEDALVSLEGREA